MRKIVLMFAVATLLMSCGKVPQEKYDLAKSCIDSLKQSGAQVSIKYDELIDRMAIVDKDILKQNTMLFTRYDFTSSELDNIIRDARRFIITNDRPAVKPIEVKDQNTNIIRLEIEITFDTKQDALGIANQVDEAVRRSMNLNAKLISVKIKE
jgi:hypothetical protein